MDDGMDDCGAFGEAVVFLNHFKDLPDHRQAGKVMYPLDEVLLLQLMRGGRAGGRAGGFVTANDTESPVSSMEAMAQPEIAWWETLVLAGVVDTKSAPV